MIARLFRRDQPSPTERALAALRDLFERGPLVAARPYQFPTPRRSE